jgi:hypothetical protein
MSSSIISPFPFFTDTTGAPLEGGYIYIGQSNLNPETAPVNVFWDAALTIPAPNPVRTVGGYPSRSGTASRFYAATDTYSITVRNRNHVLVFSAFDQSDAPTSVFDISTQLITATAGQITFTLTTFSYLPGTETLEVYRNGLRLNLGLDYLETNSLTVTLTAPAALGDQFLFQGGAVVTGDQVPGSDVSFIQAGTGAVTRNIQDKAREIVSVLDFGAVGDGITNDTDAINAALAHVATLPEKALWFPAGSYSVSTLTIDLTDADLFFDGAQLVARSSAAQDCLLRFKGVHCNVYGLKLNGNFKTNYTTLMWWYDADRSSQFNSFTNLEFRYAKRGLIYGALPTAASTLFAQSENSIFALMCRGIERPLYNNHRNGRLILSGGQLSAGPEEWAASPNPGGFIGADMRSFEQFSGVLVLDSCEIQNAATYGTPCLYGYEVNANTATPSDIELSEVYLDSCVIEMASGGVVNAGKIVACSGRTEITRDGQSAINVPVSASQYSRINFANHNFYRATGTGAYDDRPVVYNYGSSEVIEYIFDNCNFSEWNLLATVINGSSRNSSFNNCRWRTTASGLYAATFLINTNNQSLVPYSVDITGATTNGWYLYNQYGGGTSAGLNADVPAGTNFRNSLEIVAGGEAVLSTADTTSLATVKATCIPVTTDDKFSIEGWVRIAAGSQGSLVALALDASGVPLAGAAAWIVAVDQNNPLPNITTSWQYIRAYFAVPSSSVYYIGVGVKGSGSTVRMCGLKLLRANWPNGQ